MTLPPARISVRAGLGAGILAMAFAVSFASEPKLHLRVCSLSTTTGEEPSCATVTESYLSPASASSPSP